MKRNFDDLTLLPVTPEMQAIFKRSRATFSQSLGINLPAGWPEFPEAFEPRVQELLMPWTGYLFILAGKLIGNGGFVGPPDAAGVVEIGFEIAPAYRNKGYATLAASKLIQVAFDHGVARVVAHSLAVRNASNSVMMKVGMVHVATIQNDEHGSVWRYEIDTSRDSDQECFGIDGVAAEPRAPCRLSTQNGRY